MGNITKVFIGKLDLEGISPQELPKLAQQTGFELIELLPQEGASYHQLSANWHRDPFDRMLIWQDIQNNFTIISKDSHVASYRSVGLKVV